MPFYFFYACWMQFAWNQTPINRNVLTSWNALWLNRFFSLPSPLHFLRSMTVKANCNTSGPIFRSIVMMRKTFPMLYANNEADSTVHLSKGIFSRVVRGISIDILHIKIDVFLPSHSSKVSLQCGVLCFIYLYFVNFHFDSWNKSKDDGTADCHGW